MLRAIGKDKKSDVRAARADVGFIEISVGAAERGQWKSVILTVQEAFEFGRDLKELAERVAKEESKY